jgi:hypothetical protein
MRWDIERQDWNGKKRRIKQVRKVWVNRGEFHHISREILPEGGHNTRHKKERGRV